MTLYTEANRPAQNDVAKTPATVATIGTSSGTVIAANPSRVEVTIVNDHASNIVYLALGATAVLNSGIRLNAGGSYTTNAYTGIISAIATGISTNLTVSQV